MTKLNSIELLKKLLPTLPPKSPIPSKDRKIKLWLGINLASFKSPEVFMHQTLQHNTKLRLNVWKKSVLERKASTVLVAVRFKGKIKFIM